MGKTWYSKFEVNVSYAKKACLLSKTILEYGQVATSVADDPQGLAQNPITFVANSED